MVLKVNKDSLVVEEVSISKDILLKEKNVILLDTGILDFLNDVNARKEIVEREGNGEDLFVILKTGVDGEKLLFENNKVNIRVDVESRADVKAKSVELIYREVTENE